ncbi:ZIP family metal transporter [Robertmurraya sp. GLU-23]
MVPIWIFSASLIGLSLGGFLAVVLVGLRNNKSTVILFSGGMILGLLLLEIIPEALEENHILLLIGIIISIAFYIIVHDLLDRFKFIKKESNNSKSLKAGLIIVASLLMHNFPLGVTASNQLLEGNRTFLVAVLIHNIPEGVILVSPLLSAGLPFIKVIALIICVTIPTTIGAFSSMNDIVGVETVIQIVFLGISIGMLLSVALKEMIIPYIKEGRSNILSYITLILGFLLIYLVF